MKRNFIKKIIALALSAMLTFLTTTVYATTFEDDGYRSEYIDYDADYSKSDLDTLFMIMPIGGKNTPESTKRLSDAWDYAFEVFENPDATQEEINTAYIELMESLERLEPCKLDDDLLMLCYDYCRYMNENFSDYFTEDSRKILKNCQLDAQITILYTNTQEGIDKILNDITDKLRTLEFEKENTDIILWDELVKFNSYLDKYIDEEITLDVEYTYNRIPAFVDYNGYRMTSFMYIMASPMINSKRYDKYILEAGMYYIPSSLGQILVNMETGEVITIEEGIEKGIVDFDKLFNTTSSRTYSFDMHIIGDADCDNKLTVKDATYIQKICAKIQKDSNTYLGDNFNDYNKDGKVTIIDATEIQKSLV